MPSSLVAILLGACARYIAEQALVRARRLRAVAVKRRPPSSGPRGTNSRRPRSIDRSSILAGTLVEHVLIRGPLGSATRTVGETAPIDGSLPSWHLPNVPADCAWGVVIQCVARPRAVSASRFGWRLPLLLRLRLRLHRLSRAPAARCRWDANRRAAGCTTTCVVVALAHRARDLAAGRMMLGANTLTHYGVGVEFDSFQSTTTSVKFATGISRSPSGTRSRSASSG